MARKNARSLWTDYVKGVDRQEASGKPAKRADPSTKQTAKVKQLAGSQVFRGRVLGVDPSLRGMGIALVRVDGKGAFSLEYSRTLKLSKTLNFYDCLGDIAQEMEVRMNEQPPDHVAVEETIYVQNFRTAQIMGAARGAALAAVTRRKIPVYEYAPLRIKQAVVGYGRASKEQVGGMVRGLLNLKDALPPDESDAAAAAICHAYTWHGA